MKKLLSVFFTMLFSSVLFAQSADVITEILSSQQANLGQVAYLCAIQQNLVQEDASYEDAVAALVSEGLISEESDSSESVTLARASFLLSKNWEINGGVMYSLTNGSQRYTFKQFVADGVLAPTAEPSSFISGAEVLNLYSACLRRYGGYDVKTVSMEAE
ncbi:MAG: hypothetical protein IJ688_08795 [Treponema sp.]|nr:hypothetical protein [Treponema sp.]